MTEENLTTERSSELAAKDELTPWQIPLLGLWAKESIAHHAYLLIGQKGSGIEALGYAQARAWLCMSPTLETALACGQCASCQWWTAGSHPDFYLIEPETQKKDLEEQSRVEIKQEKEPEVQSRLEIKVDAIRALTHWANTTAHHDKKIVLIHPADSLNLQAANALLKLLEEPAQSVRFILTCSDLRRMPLTVVSRCFQRKVNLPPAMDAVQWLVSCGLRKELAQNVLAQAGGAPSLALELSAQQTQAARRAFLTALSNPRELSALMHGDDIEKQPKANRKQALGAQLEWLLAWVHDIALCGAGGQARYNQDFQPAIAQLAQVSASVHWFRYYTNLLERKQILQHPLNPRLVLEDALMQYKTIATDNHERR